MTVKLYGELKGKAEQDINKKKEDASSREFLMEMKLHQVKLVYGFDGVEVRVMRVPGGWIYITVRYGNSVSSIFVSEKDMGASMKIEEE